MAQPEVRDGDLVQLLQERDGVKTVVMLRDGRRLIVYDIAWGYDIGDQWAHVTTNISPRVEGASVDVFYTSDVASVIDPRTNEMIYRSS